MKGYIKLYRQIQKNNLWPTDRPYTGLEAWIYLLLNANHADGKTKSGVPIKRGELITSEIKLAELWKWSRGKVRRFLDGLKMEQMCSKNGTTKYTTLTLINYGLYQGDDTTDDTTFDTTFDTTRSTQTRMVKKTKKDISTDVDIYTPSFDQFWSCYPRDRGKPAAFKAWNARLKKNETPDRMTLASQRYAQECNLNKTDQQYIKHASTFIGPDVPYLDYLKSDWKPEIKNRKVQNSNAMDHLNSLLGVDNFEQCRDDEAVEIDGIVLSQDG